jgi:hypothetical protein
MSLRSLYAYHEAGHAVVAELLGVPVHMVTLHPHGGRTRHSRPPSEVARAAILWGGVAAESLDDAGPQDPSSWLVQPDAAAIRELPAPIRNQGFEQAQALLLGDPDNAARVVAIANALLRRRGIRGTRRLLGWTVRRLMENPPPGPVHDYSELGFA